MGANGPRAGALPLLARGSNSTSFWTASDIVPGNPFQDFTGTIAGSDTYAKWKYSGSLAHEWQRLTVGLRWHHVSAFKDSSVVTNPASTIAGPGAVDYFDLYGRLAIGERIEVRAGVTSLGDVQPQQVGNLPGLTNPAVYDVIGRAYYLGLKVGFQ
jgi:hypothetical protein